MWTETQLAYLAGILDGEGTIYLQKRTLKTGKYSYSIRFSVTNTDKKLIDWLHNLFGGLVYQKKGCNDKCKDRYEWILSRTQFDKFASLIHPYVISKKPQLEIGIKFRQTFSKENRHHGDMEYLHKVREEYLHQMRSLNKKGI